MKNRLTLTGLLICSFSWVSYGQKDEFQFRRDIENITSPGWYQINLPVDVIGRTQPQLGDVRIYHIDKADTVEVPFLLKIQEDVVTENTINVPMVNKSFKDGKLYVTLEMKQERANYIHLNFSENNFDGFASIEGSNDQKEWFSIIEKQRILAINNQDVDFNFTALNFPVSSYSFLRVQMEANKPVNFQSASVKKIETIAGKASPKPLTFNSKVDKKLKQTTAEIAFSNTSLINQIKVDIISDNDYYRPFTLEILRDSAKSEQGWLFYYDVITNGYLTSTDSGAITFQPVKASKLKLVIKNSDNLPLNVKNIRASGPDVVLIAKINPGKNFLAYGNAVINAPSYDINHFEKNIPSDIPQATLKDEVWIGEETSATNPLFERQLWLWIVMTVIIALLGFFTMRMMRKV